MNKILCIVIKRNQTNNFSLNFDKNNQSHNMRSKSKLKQMQYEIITEGNVNPIRNELGHHVMEDEYSVIEKTFVVKGKQK